MKGRFEQPRNRFREDPAPRNTDCPEQRFENSGRSYENRQNSYGQSPYGNNPYGQQGPRNPGNRQPPQRPNPGRKPERGSFLWGLLSFLFPLIGLILFFAFKKNRPGAARAARIGAVSGFITLLVLVLVLTASLYLYYNHMLDKMNIVEMTKPVYTEAPTEAPLFTEATEAATQAVETTEAPVTEPPKATRDDYVNFLVVGQASRSGEDERFADTMLVCTLNKFDNSITVTSLLRDSFVQPPAFRGHTFGHIKLTTVYHLGSHYDGGKISGSMELMNMTLYNNFGLEIDHNVEVDFEVFEKLINLLGGVDIEMTQAEADYMTQCAINLHLEGEEYNYKPGVSHLDGLMTLTYARMRKAEGDGDSDIRRTERQRHLIELLLNKVKALSLSDLQNIANEVLGLITTNMSKEEITDMLKTVLPMLPTMQFKSGGTCPQDYWGELVDIYHDGMKHSVLKFSPQDTKKVMRELTLGEFAK